MLVYHTKLPEHCGISQYFNVVYHGLPLDLSMAGYLTCLPSLLLLAGIWIRKDIITSIMKSYIIMASAIISTAFAVNIGLYDYWGFPLDATPIFYFFSSPKDAMASITPVIAIIGVFAIVLLTSVTAWVIYKTIVASSFCGINNNDTKGNRTTSTVAILLLTIVLILPMRGGLTVSTANVGKAYFSEHAILNHAAVNPLFSLIESIRHQEDFGSQYRFMEDAKADKIFAKLTATSSQGNIIKITNKRPDIYLFVLESFSMELWKSSAIPNLQKIADEGIFFTNFYANSFRTDRGLVAILSGFPAQPAMSIMKYPKKTAKLPSIAGCLRTNGYGLKYYYGGDADFTNMRSYLVAQGFEDIVSDVDFPVEERLSKWGAPDDKVFSRLLSDIRGKENSKPMFRVLQTSSSHEPFDVPYHKFADERLNAFAYTDSCIGNFITKLKASDRWANSLVIMIPDHQGCWPQGITNEDIRHYHIPMIWTGGVIAGHEEITTIGSQQDFAATLLGQLGINHNDMTFSKDLLCPTIPHFAFFTVNDIFGMITADNILIHDNKSGKVTVDKGKAKGANLEKGKAYLQKLFDIIALL